MYTIVDRYDNERETWSKSKWSQEPYFNICTPELAHVLVLLLKIGTNFIQYGERERQRTSG